MTIQTILRRAAEFLTKNGIDEARLDAEVLLAHVLKMRRLYLYVHLDLNLADDDVNQYKNLLHRRANHVPVAQLTGVKEFMGLDFNVTPDVLVPRPETEILVQTSVEILGRRKGSLAVADLGTGSGAIAVSLLHYLDNVAVDAVDISPKALAVAKSNAEKFAVANRLTLHEGDFLTPLAGKKFDAIVSNPPYIPTATIDELTPEVADHEPRIALDGGVDGLDCYKKIIAGAAPLLNENGFLALEVGINEADHVKKMLADTNHFGKIDGIWDLIGIERIIFAYKK